MANNNLDPITTADDIRPFLLQCHHAGLMYKDRMQAAWTINRLIEFDGTAADDIRRAAVKYLSTFGDYEADRNRFGSTVEAIEHYIAIDEPREDADAWSGGFAKNH